MQSIGDFKLAVAHSYLTTRVIFKPLKCAGDGIDTMFLLVDFMILFDCIELITTCFYIVISLFNLLCRPKVVMILEIETFHIPIVAYWCKMY